MDINTFTKNIRDSEATLYRVSKSILSNDCDCEDAVGETILKAYTKLYTLKQESFFKTWLVRILINECYKIRRKYKATVNVNECEQILVVKEEDHDHTLYEAIMALPQKIRIAITLFYIEGYSIEEIKDILHIPSGTVKSRLSRGRHLLKTYLESEEQYENAKFETSLSGNTNQFPQQN